MRPASMLPMPPAAMTAKLVALAHVAGTPRTAKLCKRKTEIHAHMA